jgi:cytochrome P450
MSQSVMQYGSVEEAEAAEAVAVELFGTPEGRQDPYPLYRRLRELAPVHSSPAYGTLLTRYDDCQAILRDPRLVRGWATRMDASRSDWHQRPALSGAEHWMLMLDGADHTRLRKLVVKAFTPRTVERLRPRIEAMADALLDPLEAAGGGELMEALAFPLPVQVIAELLGVPRSDCEPFRSLIQSLAGMFELDPGPGVLDAADDAWVAIEAYFADLVTEKRKRPDDALLSQLVAVDDHGDRLSDAEITGLASLVFLAGFETTTSLVGNGMLGLLRYPDQLDVLRADPELFPRLPDELLRYDGTVQLVSRATAEQIEVSGRVLPAGTTVMAVVGAGNHDPSRFPDPDRLDVTREEIRPLTFGGGVHFCLGAALARVETEIVFRRLLERFGTIELVGDAPRRDTLSLRGPLAVPLALSAAAASRGPAPSETRAGAATAATAAEPGVAVAPRPTGTSGILPLRPAGQDLAWRNDYRRHVEAAAMTDPGVAAIVDLLRRVDFFAGCSEAELTGIASTAYPIAFEAGAVVCEEGAESLECYVIAEGTAAVTAGGGAVGTVGADDVVGERGPVTGAPRSATVTAASHLITYAISRDRLLELRSNPVARAGMEAAMLKRYGVATTKA